MEKRKWWQRKQIETRQTLEEVLIQGNVNSDIITKSQALNIPSVSACVDLICNTIASLPIYLYEENEGKVTELDDYRVSLLNDDTQDSLNGWEWKRAMVEDYLLNGGGYTYIERERNTIRSLHYIDSPFISVTVGNDPIYKTHDVLINGQPFRDFEFLKLLRQSKDGATGRGIIAQNNKVLSVAYNSIVFEDSIVKVGGTKKGFLKSVNRISSDAIAELKRAWANLYRNGNSDSVIVLNNGLDFQESSSTNLEMQLNENKKTNSDEIAKIFLVPPSLLDGSASDEVFASWVKNCIMPIVSAFEIALNKELLLNREKGKYYFAFQVEDLLKGDIEKRFRAYDSAVKSGWISKNEIRYLENYEPIEGLDIITMSLGEILYDIKSKTFFTPNMDAMTNMEDGKKPSDDDENNIQKQGDSIK